MMKRFLFLAIVFVSVSISAQRGPKNVILLIGDGLGINQLYAAMVTSETPLAIEQLTDIGFTKTWSFSNFTTDSGAAGTALATGVKTRNNMIGMGPDSVAVPNLTQFAQRRGLATGIVSACAVTHATPAAFVAHQINRNMYEEIALDYLTTQPDVFIGGGRRHFVQRKDGRNLIINLIQQKYSVVTTMDDLKKVTGRKVAGLLFDEHPPAAPERGDFLPEASEIAINLLNRNRNGFFLMIEGSQIDWAGHANDTQRIIAETIDFDNAVARAIEFAKKDKRTLVIVASDHETGGMTLPNGNINQRRVTAAYSTTGHSGELVPIFAYGPGSEHFRGIMDNTDVPRKIAALLMGVTENRPPYSPFPALRK